MKKVLIILAVGMILAAGIVVWWKLFKSRSVVQTQTTQTTQSTATPTSTTSSPTQSEVKWQTQKPKSSRSDPGGPYYHQVYSARSKDGLNWTKDDKLLFEHASVPGAVIREGIIYLYFVDASKEEDQLSVAISKDLGKTFEKQKVEIEGMESNQAVDPHPELVSDQIRLYYFGGFFEVGDPTKGEQKHKFYSAVSDDGVNFKNQQLAYEDQQITDPDVFKTDKDWRMLVSKGRQLDLLISTDNGITFAKESSFSWDKGGVCDTFNFQGTYRTFYCGTGSIDSATGAEQGKLTAENGTRISVESGKMVCDPSVIQLPDGSYLMFYKTQGQSTGQPMPQSPTAPDSTLPQPSQ